MTDNTPSRLRSEADAIRAVNALVEAVRQGASNVKALLESVLAFGDAEANELLGRAGQAFVSGEDVLFLLKTERPEVHSKQLALIKAQVGYAFCLVAKAAFVALCRRG